MEEDVFQPEVKFPPLKINPQNAQAIWERIVQMEGEVFFTISRKIFKYSVNGNGIQVTGNKDYRLSQDNFFKAIQNFDPGALNSFPENIVGRSYVWGIFNRICQGN